MRNAGQYHVVRRHFLNWLKDYLSDQKSIGSTHLEWPQQRAGRVSVSGSNSFYLSCIFGEIAWAG